MDLSFHEQRYVESDNEGVALTTSSIVNVHYGSVDHGKGDSTLDIRFICAILVQD